MAYYTNTDGQTKIVIDASKPISNDFLERNQSNGYIDFCGQNFNTTPPILLSIPLHSTVSIVEHFLQSCFIVISERQMANLTSNWKKRDLVLDKLKS